MVSKKKYSQGFSKIIVIIFLPLIITLLLVLTYIFIVQPNKVAGSSMAPNFPNEAYLLSEKVTYRIEPPSRGDVIMYRTAANSDLDFISRIVGLPGETISFKNGQVSINGTLLPEPYASQNNTFSLVNEFQIPLDNYFVLGDNREHSLDSRNFGFIPRSRIVSRFFRCLASCESPVNLPQ